ncbi:MAG TPA: outer membrane beta-barrel protein [Candidatus Binatia bacterium]|nr:outer membrane beta-barrel protein [Candidatus Binatia bacterium]
MRTTIVMAVLAAALACGTSARAEDAAEEAPPDPTRGQWDAFLDPVRDAEDEYVVGTQKWIEDQTKIHVGAGITWPTWFHNFNEPDSDLNTLHSLDPDHASPEFNFGQLFATRANEGWIPGFGLKLDVGRAAKRIKADWDGDGGLNVGDTFEKNSFEVQDAYLTWTVPEDMPAKGLTVKAGKFVTLLGAEVIEPWANYNFSRSFLFGLAIPFTHTGGLVTYPVTDKLSVTGGVVVGWDNVADNNDSPSFMGNVTYIVNDMVTLAGNGIFGPEQIDKIGPKRGVADFVATIKPTSALTFLLNYDWGHEDDAAVAEAGTALWQGFAAVANYQFTDRFSTAVRGEWFEDHTGTRTGIRQTLVEGTLTAKYQLTQHLAMRAEYRRDYSTRSRVFEKEGASAREYQDIAGFEFTYLFN